MGVSPYFLGAEIKTTTENTTLTERYTEGTRTGGYKRALRAPPIKQRALTTVGVPFYSSDYGNRAISAVEDICKDGITTGTITLEP